MKNIFKKIIASAIAVTMLISSSALLSSCGDDIPVIGISQYAQHPSLDNCRLGFIEGLKEAGLVEGVDFKIDYQNAGNNDNTAIQIAQSFSSKNVALMCAIATPSATTCYAAAEGTDIPVIFTAISDPAQANLTTGNVTGTSDKLPVNAQLELIRKMQPDATRIGIIYTTSEPNSVSTIADYKAAAPSYGFEIVDIGVTSQSEVTMAADALISQNVDCFSNLTDNNVVNVLASILEKTNEAGIPVYGSEIEQVKIGCVASAGIDYFELGKQTGKMAAQILRGEKTADELDIFYVTDFSYYVNSTAANELGIAIPADVLAAAEDTSVS